MKLPLSEEGLDKLEIYEAADETAIPYLSDNTGWPGRFRKWIHSRKNQPIVINGAIESGETYKNNWVAGLVDFFETVTLFTWSTVVTAWWQWINKSNRSDVSLIVTDTDVDVTSSAGSTLTCPASHAYRVIHAGLSNANRAPQLTLTFTPSGGTASVHLFPAGVQTVENIAIGKAGVAAGVTGTNVMNEIWLQAGDTLDLSDGNFVAADVMRKQFIFEDWDLS